jgi:hypothetical protein
VSNIKFLVIYVNDSVNWNYHMEYIISRLSKACYVMRCIEPYMPVSTLKTIYYSYCNFWGNSPHGVKILGLQNKRDRIMMGSSSRVSCRNRFKSLEILPLASQYILLLLLFVVKNKNLFIINSEIHSQNTRQVKMFICP